MFNTARAFSGFSVDDLATAKEFYGTKLGLTVSDEHGMGLRLELPGGGSVFIYPKDSHQPATYTVLNFSVANIDEAMAALKEQGITFERYDTMQQDENDIARGLKDQKGPDIAWFTDPAGNILSVLQEK